MQAETKRRVLDALAVSFDMTIVDIHRNTGLEFNEIREALYALDDIGCIQATGGISADGAKFRRIPVPLKAKTGHEITLKRNPFQLYFTIPQDRFVSIMELPGPYVSYHNNLDLWRQNNMIEEREERNPKFRARGHLTIRRRFSRFTITAEGIEGHE